MPSGHRSIDKRFLVTKIPTKFVWYAKKCVCTPNSVDLIPYTIQKVIQKEIKPYLALIAEVDKFG